MGNMEPLEQRTTIEFTANISPWIGWVNCSNFGDALPGQSPKDTHQVAITRCRGLIPMGNGNLETEGRALITWPRSLTSVPVLTQNPKLWETFIQLKPTEADVLSFSARYGALESMEAPDAVYFQCERLESWAAHIRDMQLAYWIWQALLRQEMEKLESIYPAHWKYGSSGTWVSQPARTELEHYKDSPLDDLEQRGWEDLSTLISDRTGPTRPIIRLSRNEQSIALKPVNLITGLWLQFSFEVANRPYLRCQQCIRMYTKELSGHTDRAYCSRACKQKAYRARKAQVPQPAPQPHP